MATIVRRRKLGMSSVKGIVENSTTGIKWCRNDQGIPLDDVYIRWGCTAHLPNPRAKVLNTAKAIGQVNDKIAFRKLMQEQCPDVIPKTFYHFRDVPREILMRGVIVRPRNHAQGRNLHLTRNERQLIDACERYGNDVYISEYIPKAKEFRVFVGQGRAVWVAEKTPGNPEDIAWNVARGGRFDNVRFGEWDTEVLRVATTAFNATKLDFGGVDVMVDGNGRAYVIEINSAPSQTSPYRQSCVSKLFDYMMTEGTERIEVFNGEGKYLKYIHPAIDNKAKLNVEEELVEIPEPVVREQPMEDKVGRLIDQIRQLTLQEQRNILQQLVAEVL